MAERPTIGVRVPQEWKDELDQIARQKGKPVSQLVYELIADYLGREPVSSVNKDSEDVQQQLREINNKISEVATQEQLTVLTQKVEELQSLQFQSLELPSHQVVVALTGEVRRIIDLFTQLPGPLPRHERVVEMTPTAEVKQLPSQLPAPNQGQTEKSRQEVDDSDDDRMDRLQEELQKRGLKPFTLSAKALGRRLYVSQQAVLKAKERSQEEFAKWSCEGNARYGRRPDPDGLRWRYNPADKRFYAED